MTDDKDMFKGEFMDRKKANEEFDRVHETVIVHSADTGETSKVHIDFKKYPRISRLDNAQMTITQKIHGTNAQVYIYKNEGDGELQILPGSRNRWLYPSDDNYGFAEFVEKNEKELIASLGEGVHYGEWAGPGINSGEGLKEKMFLLFEWYKYDPDIPMPKNVGVVPLLYTGPVNLLAIEETMDLLKENGSALVEGFMSPEGIVIDINGQKLKKVFEAEETKWKTTRAAKADRAPAIDYSYLLQPIRLQKILSRDERYVREYPTSLSRLCKDYIEDLVSENQIEGNEDEIASIRKGASKFIFKFLRESISSTDLLRQDREGI